METLLRIGVSNAAAAACLALVACAVGLLVRKPALTHGLWLLVLLKLVSPPLWTIPLHVSGSAEAPASPAPLCLDRAPAATTSQRQVEVKRSDVDSDVVPLDDATLPAGASDRVIPWSQLATAPRPTAAPVARPSYRWIAPVLLAIWLGGAAICAVISIGRLVCFRRMVLNCAVPAPQAIQRQARALSRRLGMRACPDVWLVPGELSPMLWAAGRATWVLLPHALLQRLDEHQQATLLAHELAHLRRRDHWVRYLELITTCLYWWHPVCWWARRELREAGEQCCDAWVLWALPGSFRKYATALLETIEFLSHPRPSVPLLASGLGQFGQLKRRLTMLKQGTVSKALTWRGLFGLSGAAALLLPLVPTLAQKSDEPRKLTVSAVEPDDSARQEEESASKIRAAAGQQAVEPQEAEENEAQERRAEADAERVQADTDRAQAEAERAQADAERKQSEGQRAIEEAVDRAQAVASKAAAAAQEQYAKAMAEAQQAIESAAKEQQEKGGDDGDAQRSKEEFRNIARQAQREAARAMEQAKREMAQAMGEAKRAMAEAKRQAEQAQREMGRFQRDGESNLKRQLEEAHRQIRELSKRLAETQNQLQGRSGRGRYTEPVPENRDQSGDNREERLQRLEEQLQSLLGEVKSMQRERGSSSQEKAK